MSEIIPSVVPSAPLHISSISIRLDDASDKKVDFAELEFDSQRQEIRRKSDQDKDLSEDFDPAIAVTTERFSLFVHCQSRAMGVFPKKPIVNFSLNKEDILSNAVDHDDAQREYRTTKKKITVVIIVYSDVQQICPRFRLLVIGKTGAGKSSLIQRAFGINDVNIAEYDRGKANINKPLTPPENARFVLHDSEGFEAADEEYYRTAIDYIKLRCKTPKLALRDQIHAVWLCLSIPLGGGSLLERGVENLLKSRKEILGDVPIIVVFTKLDEFVEDFLEDNAEKYDEDALEVLKINTLNELCIQPLEKVAETDILHTIVSTEKGYESTIRQLIDLTTTGVEKFVDSEAALAMMIAQRAHIGLNVKASITIIRKRYWGGIAVGMNFIGFTMLDCFSKIHEDIIGAWNLGDTDSHLVRDEFKALMLKDLDNADLPHTGQAVGFDLVTKIIAFLAPLAQVDQSGVFPITVGAVSAGVVLVEWAYEIYQQTNDALQRIMTYIVDLTCIMQILFLLCSHPPGSKPPPGLIPHPGPISLPAIEIAIKAYEEAGKSDIHSEVKSRVSVAHAKGDDALDEIDKLIKRHSIKDEQVQDLRQKLGFYRSGEGN